jgi:general secretion pathway protein D
VLTISPHISEGNYVNLNIDILVEKFVGTVAATTTIPPPKTSRQIVTTVNVPDRYTVVIGGLITNDESETAQGVPFLWKIPILGHLFRRDQESRTKSTLYVFVTPVILYDQAWGDLGHETRKRKSDMEAQNQPLPQLTPWPPLPPRERDLFRNAPTLKKEKN